MKLWPGVQSLVTMTLFLRTNLRPGSIANGQEYYGVIFFSLIATMFDGFAEETLTVRQLSLQYRRCHAYARC